MAEQNEGQERTEEATPRRREQAREQGQVPRSRELTTTALLLGAASTLMLLAPFIVGNLRALATATLSQTAASVRTPDAMQAMYRPDSGVPAAKFRPPVYVTLWS